MRKEYISMATISKTVKRNEHPFEKHKWKNPLDKNVSRNSAKKHYYSFYSKMNNVKTNKIVRYLR